MLHPCAKTRAAYKKGLIIETSGTNDEIIKLLCPLIIAEVVLAKGIDIIEESIKEVLVDVDVPEDRDYFDDVTVNEKKDK